MEKISNGIASYLASELNYDDNKKAVMAYGIFALVQTIISIGLVAVIGAIFRVPVEALIISFSVSILRKYSGGAHASSAERCVALGTIICIILALIIRNFFVNIFNYVDLAIIIIAISVAYGKIYQLVPVDNPKKPIKTQKKKDRMRKMSFIIMTVYSLFIILFILLYINYKNKFYINISMSLILGTLWQIFTLTSLGHKFVDKIDFLLAKLI